VNWGGFTQVEATLNLINASLETGEKFDRFCFLSGADFPIKTLGRIRDAFESHDEFLRVDRRINASDKNAHCNNVRYSYFVDSSESDTSNLRPGPPRAVYDKISLYHGCSWWILTENCMKYVLGFLQENEEYVAFHRHTLCPDEIVFHSIVKNSPFAARITHDFERV